MSNQVLQSVQVKFRILIALADAAVWIHGSALATKANVHEERMQTTLTFFEKRKMIKTVDWLKLTPDEQKKFMEDEASIRVIIPSIIKPLPHEDIISNISGSKKILIVEEGSKYSGWGAELSCLIYDKIHGNLEGPIHRIGAKQSPIPSSSKLEKSILPQEKDIANMINNIIP